MYYLFINILQLVIFISISLCQYNGSISGRISDKETHQPIEGANIIVINTSLGSASDIDGNFSIQIIPVGSYTIQVNMIGYKPIIRPNININTSKTTQLSFYLEESVIEGQAIFVNEGYFEKTQDAVVSNRTMDYEEIRSDPVGVYDIQMMMQALPAVVSESDQSNEIIVRGGDVGENLFIMDHIEIPNPNHFGENGTSGGAINIINSRFIEKIDFFAGGFPAKYGDKQSSVMDVTLKEGNPQKHDIEAEANMAGIGITLDGPIIKNKATYMASYKKSFLKYVIKSAGLQSVPEYWNGQTKIVYNFNSKNKLVLNYLIGADAIKIENENRPDLHDADHVEANINQSTLGLTYKSLFSSQGYYHLTLAKNKSQWNSYIYNIVDNIKNIYIDRDNIEQDTYLKGQLVYKINHSITFNTGFNIKEGSYSLNEHFEEDTIYTYFYYDESKENYMPLYTSEEYYNWLNSAQVWYSHLDEIEPTKFFSSVFNFLDWNDQSSDQSLNPIIGFYDGRVNPGLNQYTQGTVEKYSAFFQFKFSFLEKIKITIGSHYNNIPFNSTNQLSPRLGFSYSINPITLFNVAYGKYYQTPSYWMLLNPKNIEYGGAVLSNSHTEQMVIGLERYFANDMKATIELYNKDYYNMPIQNSVLTEDDLFDRWIGFSNVGSGNSKGIELFIQKKYSNNWYTTFSYSNSVARSNDPRESKDGTFARTYDYGQILTFIGGYKFMFRHYNWYNRIRNDKILRNLLYIPIMPSDIFEISFRYKFMGGRPYTLREYEPTYRRWTYDNDWNTERYNYYSRLDIMFLRRFNFNKINLITFLDLQNVFDRSNEWEYLYLSNGSKEMALQYKQLPIGGIIIEF